MAFVRASVIACLFGTVVLGVPAVFAADGSTTTTTTTDDQDGVVAGGGACNGGGAEGLVVSLAAVGGLLVRRVRQS
ncbi:MAG: hypothetical protein U1F43_14710 [Myxococcota bacterium]